jgi:hypothetical protein
MWFFFFTIATRIFNIKAFRATIDVCSLVSTKSWTTLCHFLLAFLLLIQVFIFWVHWWYPNHSLRHLWLKFFMRILGQYLVSLWLQIFKWLLWCFRYVMPNTLATCFIHCFHLHVFCNITLNLIFVP